MNPALILDRLNQLQILIESQIIYHKPMLNFKETCQYLDLSESHLYKLTSSKQIPFYQPGGKKLYFKREELNQWLQQNRHCSMQELDSEVEKYIKEKFI